MLISVAAGEKGREKAKLISKRRLYIIGICGQIHGEFAVVNPFNFDYVAFEKLLTSTYREFINQRHENHPDEVFYWYGLSTYEEFGPLRPIMTGEIDLDRLVGEQLNLYPEWYKGMNRNDVRSHLRYSSLHEILDPLGDEEGQVAALFDQLDSMTSKGMRQFDGTYATAEKEWGEDRACEHVEPFVERFHDVCITVLKSLDQEGLFSYSGERDKVIVTFKMYDEIEWNDVVALNSADAVARYRNQLAKVESFERLVSENMKQARL